MTKKQENIIIFLMFSLPYIQYIRATFKFEKIQKSLKYFQNAEERGWLSNVNNKYKKMHRKGRDGYWQPIEGTGDDFYVYSAFLERRKASTQPTECFYKNKQNCNVTGKAIRVIGIGLQNSDWEERLFCRLWLPDKRHFVISALVKTMDDRHKLKYTAIFILCHLSKSGLKASEVVNATVAVMAKWLSREAPSNFLRVQDTKPRRRNKETLHVCVQPFYDNLDLFANDTLLEWIEFNRLLGVTHFNMYQSQLGLHWKTAYLVKHYEREHGVISLLPWNLPKRFQSEILNHGQLAVLNDCLYRSMSSASWLLMLDVDELVVPRRHETLIQLLDQIVEDNGYKEAAVFFRNFVFNTLWKDDPRAPGPQITASKTLRYTDMYYFLQQRKYLVWTQSAVELGLHSTRQMMPEAYEIHVPMYYGFVQTYRAEPTDEQEDGKKVVDRTAQNYWNNLVNRITKEKNHFLETQLSLLHKG